jgi:SAM-dependent methyltransferase
MAFLARKITPEPVKEIARELYSRAAQVAGARHACPVCGKPIWTFQRFPKFYTDNQRKFGYPYAPSQHETCNREAYLCPLCGAADRERLYALYIRDYLWPAWQGTARSMLDIAPSKSLSQFIKKLIVKSGLQVSYRTADLFMDGLDDRVDITDMQIYQDNQFDFFICSHVLEHVGEDRKALGELHRILKPAGQGILMVPIVLGIEEIDEDPSITDPAERWRRFGQHDHVRVYSKRGFLDRVSEAGFRVREHGWEYFGADVFARHGIDRQSKLYVVEKWLTR